MPRKKSIEELRAEAAAAEKRAKEAREKVARAKKAEEARQNVAVIRAVHEWLESFPEEKRVAWENVPDIFKKWTQNNHEKYASDK